MRNSEKDQPAEKTGGSRPARALIFANGHLPSLRAARALIQPGDRLIAADGGARHLMRLGLTPAVVVGDMDSLTETELAQLEQAGARLVRYPKDKDETDLELALGAALAEGWRSVRVVGALGGRLDQTLGNLALLAQALPRGVDLRLDDGVEEVFLVRGYMEVEGEAGDVVSLLPLGGPARGVTTHALQYSLAGETLLAERTRGISNVMLGSRAGVEVMDGVLICVHRRRRK